MKHVMRFLVVSGLAPIVVLSLLLTSVHATGFNFKYTFIDGEVFSGMFEGTFRDSNVVDITAVFDPVYSGDLSLVWASDLNIGAETSLDGTTNRFIVGSGTIGGFIPPIASFGQGLLGNVQINPDDDPFPSPAFLQNETYFATSWELTEKPTSSPIPEPSTMLLFGTGVLGLIGYARRKRTLR